ncbi:hypothetical protein L873DRAFT_1564209, partial [Choiromyces venosus 120613-1]
MEVERASSTPPQSKSAITAAPPSFPSTTNSKSRKFRRRPIEDDDEATPTTTATTNTSPTTAATPSQLSQTTTLITSTSAPASPKSERSESVPSLTDILRLRKKIARTSALRGLEVTAPKHTPEAPMRDTDSSESAAAKPPAEAELEVGVNRFTHQTGQILDVDKHMMAYIESEMSKRRGERGGGDGGGGNAGTGGNNGTGQESTRSAYWTPVVPEGRGATLGKLHEVDLGEEAKKRNIARTQEATRRLQGADEIQDSSSTAPATSSSSAATTTNPNQKKIKNRRRRNSQDVQRDKLVEEVLKESRLEMYTDPDPPEEQRGESEGAADDRIAEKFRREFLDALMSRRRRRGGDNKKKRDENKKPRGPKLGGSRQARAAMRESQNAAAGAGGTG